MQEPETQSSAARPEAAGARPPRGGTAGAAWEGIDPPTVRSGSSVRRMRLMSAGVVEFPDPGDRIDSFELEEAIGVGGMGAVFRALDCRLDRQVALKILPPEQAGDPEVVQRFYQEGRAAARLDHENIARVYTIGHDGKYHYIAFEFIEGTTIRQLVERHGPLPIGEAINYTLQIAGALVHAAERGVVHRDIKPSNIIVTPQARAKLVDMGLARRFERGGDEGLTQSGMTLGTFDYISPEQARDPRDVDVRSDLYSLGCTLFHMLTGRPPFPEGTVLQKLIQHQEEAPPDVRLLNPEVPPDLASILVKLMAKDRDRRYQTPEQLVRDLLTIAGALGLRSVSPEGLVWMSATHPTAWERHLVWGIPALALALVVAGLVWWGQEVGGPPRPSFSEGLVHVPVQPPPPRPIETPRGTEAPVPTPGASEAPEPEAAEEGPAAPLDITVDPGDDLLAKLAEAPPRSVVVLDDDGPYYLGTGGPDRTAPARLVRRDLTIKAEAGVHPVLRLARGAAAGGKAPSALLDFLGGHVTLEGLEFVLEPGEREDLVAAIRAEDTALTVRRCLFRRLGTARGSQGRLAALHVVASVRGEPPAAIFADACHFDGEQVGILAVGPADLELRDCTMGGTEPALWTRDGSRGPARPATLQLRHDSFLAVRGPVFRFEGTAPRVWIEDTVVAPADNGEITLVACDDPDALDWRGRSDLYARIGIFLQPTGPRSDHAPVLDWSTWQEGLDGIRETVSTATRGHVWDVPDPLQQLAQAGRNPTRAFQLAALRSDAAFPGARRGPVGTLEPPVRIAANSDEPLREPKRSPVSSPSGPATTTIGATEPPSRPMSLAASDEELDTNLPPEMPIATPSDQEVTPAQANVETDTRLVGVAAPEPLPKQAEPAPPAQVRTTPPGSPGTDAAVLRTADQFLGVVNQPGARGGMLRLAAGSDWELPSTALRAAGRGRWVLRAEPGPARPRIRFRPAPADPKLPTAWSVGLDLESGALQMEGIDIVLPRSDAPRQGRWAAFGVAEGTELRLTDCTVTVEGDQAISAAVVVQPGPVEAKTQTQTKVKGQKRAEGGGAHPESPAATVQMTNCLLRTGGDLVEVGGGRRLDLELNNVVIATQGSLVHAHGQPRDQKTEPVHLRLDQVTARTAGGLVQLESAVDEPELPVAAVTVRDSILATTLQDTPLFRVDGQDALASLRDRIWWEGDGVAYHQINAYRRDQSAQVGAVPIIYDRPSWLVAVGTKERASIHGDMKFARDWDPNRPAWTLRPDDVALQPDSPASSLGPDLHRIPNPPPSTS